MSSDEESSSELQVSERETQFVPQEGDDEALWEVIEITAQKNNAYKVRWAGTDAAGKPWPQSWVRKQDCTDVLVMAWKTKQARKKRESQKKGSKRKLVASKRSTISHAPTISKGSTASSSALTRRAAVSDAPRHARQKGKRSRESAALGSTPEVESSDGEDYTISRTRPKKKRKLAEETKQKSEVVTSQESYEVKPISKFGRVRDIDLPEDVIAASNHTPTANKRREPRPLTPRKPASATGSNKRASRSSDRECEAGYTRPLTGRLTPVPHVPSKPRASASRTYHPLSPPSTSSLSESAKARLQEFDDEMRKLGSEDRATSPPLLHAPSSPAQVSPPAQFSGHHGKEHELVTDNAQSPRATAAANAPLSTGIKSFSSGVTQVRATNGHTADDSRLEVIPETQTESLRSQSLSQNQHARAPFARLPTLDSVVGSGIPSVSPRKGVATPLRATGSLIAKMKCRTPPSLAVHLPLFENEDTRHGFDFMEARTKDKGDRKERERKRSRSKSGSSSESERELQSHNKREEKSNGQSVLKPIPQISPSKFAQHLPPSSIEQEDEEAAVKELVSSIEQFSSPEKGPAGRGKRRGRQPYQVIGSEEEQSEDELGLDHQEIRLRGMQLAQEVRTKKKEAESFGAIETRRVTLTDLSAAVRKDGEGKGKQPRKSAVEMLVERARERRSRLQHQEESRTVDDDDDDEDVSRCEDKKRISIEALRREEEESSQEVEESSQSSSDEHPALLEEDLEGADVDVEVGDISVAISEREVIGMVTDEENSVDNNIEISQPQAEGKDLNQLSSPLDLEYPDPLISPPRVPSPLKPTSDRPEPSGEDAAEGHLPMAPMTPRQDLERNQVDHPDESPGPSATVALPDTKAQEIARLESLLAIEQAKTADFLKEIEALKHSFETVHAAHTSQPDLESELAQVREQFAQEKEAWENERTKLVALSTSLTERKERAEKDVDFFREQYAQASGFVTSIRKENIELEKRAKVAEDQAKTGVESVKVFHQRQIETLQDDARSWKRLALFVMEKDQRTNDEIRRRAAEEPQLRMYIEKLEEKESRSIRQIAALRDDCKNREKHAKEVEFENDVWKKETVRLNGELRLLKTLFRDGQQDWRGQTSQQEPESGNPDELVFQCRWREDEQLPCGKTFMSIDDLRTHMYDAYHLGQHLYPD